MSFDRIPFKNSILILQSVVLESETFLNTNPNYGVSPNDIFQSNTPGGSLPNNKVKSYAPISGLPIVIFWIFHLKNAAKDMV